MPTKPRLFSILNLRNKSKNRKTRTAKSHDYSKLEPKNLLATIAFNPTNGVLSINGTDAVDVVEVSVNALDAALIDVSAEGEATQQFASAAINRLNFNGAGGDDTFTNTTAIGVTAFGGDGSDTLTGGSGDDFLIGGAGADTLDGGAGNDLIVGNDDDDTISGGDGDDDVRGNAGDDTISGGQGNDLVRGGDGDDTLEGDAGDDLFNGGDGDDTITDSAGDDRVFSGAGDDVINTGIGDDFVFSDIGDDTINGSDGDDTIISGAGDDFISGDAGNDVLVGSEGNDQIAGGEGDDSLFGDIGNDILNGGAGIDRLAGGTGNDSLSGGGGDDVLLGERGDDTINGGDGNDRIFASFGIDIVDGGAGDDIIAGQEGSDIINGGDGSDLIFAGPGNDVVRGGNGIDFLYGQEDDDDISGGAEVDIIHGNDGNDTLRGGVGNDRLFGNAGNDRLFGGDDFDRLFGGAGDDALAGGTGSENELSGGEGNDRFLSAVDDTIFDREGVDAVVKFVNGSSQWSDLEIEVIDTGLSRLVAETGNNVLLRDPVLDSPLVFLKENTVVPGISLSTNTIVDVEEFTFDPAVGRLISSIRPERRITFADWNENLGELNELRALEVPRAIAQNWASDEAIASVLPSQTVLFSRFELLSSWRQTLTGVNENLFFASGDGTAFYRNDSIFAIDTQDAAPSDLDARLNSVQDFASTWQLFFTPGQEAEKTRVSVKIENIDSLFSMLEIF